MRANQKRKSFRADLFVVETQRTRSGISREGRSTRPYRFGDFDILAVNMQASTGDWHRFQYAVQRWLIPRTDDPTVLDVLQPVSLSNKDGWTADLDQAIAWHLSGEERRVSAFAAP